MKKALITGITGQDGSYLAEILLEKGYEVHGIVRRSSTINTPRIDHLITNDSIFNKTLFTHHGDMTDANNLNDLVSRIQPEEIYNLAAQSHVKVSFEIPYSTAMVDAIGTLNVLESVRNHCPTAKVYQASTSEMFGGIGYNMPENGYTEKSPFHPRSPYGCAKIYAYWITKNYREAYNIFGCNGLLFNHESPRRGETFVTRKITIWCARNYAAMKEGIKVEPLQLGNLNAYRDWGHAKDYAKAQHLILQQNEPDDYVISTGETHTIREFVEKCFKYMDIEIEWFDDSDYGYPNEVGCIKGKNFPVVAVNPKYFRPSEVEYLLGDSTKARKELNWKPEYTFDGLVNDMMKHDMGLYG
jgi:GDPmannose 4,6-dehydratase